MSNEIDTVRLAQLHGLYVGQLDGDEFELFSAACRADLARRDFSGAGWSLGLAKVSVDEVENR